MRLLRTVPLLAAALLAGTAPGAVAQPRNTFDSQPQLPPGTIPAPRPAAPVPGTLPPGTAPRPLPPQGAQGGIQRSPLPPPPAGAPAPAAPATPAAPAAPGSDENGDVVVVQPPTQKIANAFAIFAGLDKITGRITSFDVGIGETAQFGALQVTPRVCYTRPANETQNTTAFAEVNEVTLEGKAKRIFTGWMFASSPGLHAVEHPIYDVWLIGCRATAPATARGQQ